MHITHIISKWLKLVQQWIQHDPGKASMVGMTVLMFVVYVIIPLSTPTTYISPDETANAFFAEQFASNGRLWFIEPLNIDAFDRIHPRSTESHGGLVHPAGWWGISMIYGLIADLTHPALMHVLTALIALLAVWAFTQLIERIFDTHTATISFFVLITHPAWWYYASRGWHHNVLLVSLIIIGAWVIERHPWESVWANGIAIASLAFLATLTRPIALIWLIPMILLMRCVAPSYKRLLDIALITALVTAMSFFIIYTQLFQTLRDITPVSDIASSGRTIIERIFPYGYSLRTLIRSAWWYAAVKCWWLTILALIGIYRIVKKNGTQFRWFKKETSFERKTLVSPFDFGRRPQTQPSSSDGQARVWYLLVTLSVSVILILWYGSWQLSDNPDSTYITLAQSYMRYWLPIYVLSVPLAAHGMMYIVRIIKQKHTFTVMMALMLALSTFAVMYGRDSIPSMIKQLRMNREYAMNVLSMVPENSIIISDRHDKLFFPNRRVMFPVDHPGTFESMRALKSVTPFFIYDLRMTDEEYRQYNEVLGHMNLTLESRASFGNEQLYAIISR